MAVIRILPETLVNQIAAGEVIERAASVLKELIENALDASAKRIRVTARGQGRELLQVVDDGCGMTREEAHLAFERHATSKISSRDDLFSIRTLGFRGEALPSIASVSFLELRTAFSAGESGTMLRFESGKLIHEEAVHASVGTSIAVHSLFHNIPVRARFLKSPATELSHLVKVFKQYAIAYPHVSWSFEHEDTLRYTLPSATLQDRLNDLFGAGFTEKLIPLKREAHGVVVEGFIGRRELNKKSRGDQFMFLNRRPIQNVLVHSAVRGALRDELPVGEWPFYVILLELDPAQFDVNVHPAKLEVKFAREREMHSAVYAAVRSALPGEAEGGAVRDLKEHFAGRKGETATVDKTGQLFTGPSGKPDYRTFRAEPEHREYHTGESDTRSESAAVSSLFRPSILQVQNKYLVSQISTGLAIIDQHAAHERILFEKALRHFREKMFDSQQLLFPLLLELESEDDSIFQEIRGYLLELGFQIRDFGPRSYSIEAVPAGLRHASETAMIRNMLDSFVEFRQAEFEARDAVAASFACHAAIRTGDRLTAEEMSALVDELFATSDPDHCPHGRPTVIKIPLSELDRRFKR